MKKARTLLLHVLIKGQRFTCYDGWASAEGLRSTDSPVLIVDFVDLRAGGMDQCCLQGTR